MKTIRKKSAGWKGAAWLLCLSMLMTAVEPLAVQAEETIDVSNVIASETTEQTASEEAGQAALEETEQTVSEDNSRNRWNIRIGVFRDSGTDDSGVDSEIGK